MVLNANITVISLSSGLLAKEAGLFTQNHRPAASQWQTVSHKVVSSTHRHELDLISQL